MHQGKSEWHNVLWLNLIVILSFALCALTGLYFTFWPEGRGAMGRTLLPSALWDFVHTWSGVTLIAAAVLHFAIHRKWVAKVTGNIVREIGLPNRRQAGVEGES